MGYRYRGKSYENVEEWRKAIRAKSNKHAAQEKAKRKVEKEQTQQQTGR